MSGKQYRPCSDAAQFAEGIQKLQQRWQKCTDVWGDYFKKEQKEFLKNI